MATNFTDTIRQISVPLEYCMSHLYNEDGDTMYEVAIIRKIIANALNSDDPKMRSLNATKVIPRITSYDLLPWYLLNHAGFILNGDRVVYPSHVPAEHTQGILAQLDSVISHYTHLKATLQTELSLKEQEANIRVAKLREERLKRESEEKEANRIRKENEAKELEQRKLKKLEEERLAAEERERLRIEERNTRIAKSIEGGMTAEEAEANELRLEEDERLAMELARQIEEEERQERENEKVKVSANQNNMGDEDDDPELLALAEKIRKNAMGGTGVGGLSANMMKKEKESIVMTDEEKEALVHMTAEEKTKFLEHKMEQARKKIQDQEDRKLKEKEQSRIQQGKAHLDILEKQEELEMVKRKAAYRLKKKEDEASRLRMAQLKAQMAADKERRLKEAEERQKEIERIRAEKENK